MKIPIPKIDNATKREIENTKYLKQHLKRYVELINGESVSINSSVKTTVNNFGGYKKLEETDAFLHRKLMESMEKIEKQVLDINKIYSKEKCKYKEQVELATKIFDAQVTIMIIKEYIYRIDKMMIEEANSN